MASSLLVPSSRRPARTARWRRAAPCCATVPLPGRGLARGRESARARRPRRGPWRLPSPCAACGSPRCPQGRAPSRTPCGACRESPRGCPRSPSRIVNALLNRSNHCDSIAWPKDPGRARADCHHGKKKHAEKGAGVPSRHRHAVPEGMPREGGMPQGPREAAGVHGGEGGARGAPGSAGAGPQARRHGGLARGGRPGRPAGGARRPQGGEAAQARRAPGQGAGSRHGKGPRGIRLRAPAAGPQDGAGPRREGFGAGYGTGGAQKLPARIGMSREKAGPSRPKPAPKGAQGGSKKRRRGWPAGTAGQGTPPPRGTGPPPHRAATGRAAAGTGGGRGRPPPSRPQGTGSARSASPGTGNPAACPAARRIPACP